MPVVAGTRAHHPRSVCPGGHPPYDQLGLDGRIIIHLRGRRGSDGPHPILFITLIHIEQRRHETRPLSFTRN